MAQPVKAFISYARVDSAFVERLSKALAERGVEFWIDQRDIPPAADWLRRIVDGIVKSTFFVFVVSPESVESRVCGVELQQAVGLHKPLVPVLWRKAEMPEALRSLQWCDFSGTHSFEEGVLKLDAALKHDPEWLAEHARLAGNAADWDTRGKPWYSLLQGKEIRIAERWLAQANETRPDPTALQLDYVQASRRFSRRWKLSAAVIGLVLVFSIVATLVLRQRSVREAQARDLAAHAVQLRESEQAALPASTLMLIEAVQELSALGVRSPDIEAMLRTGTNMLLRPLAIGVHPNGVGGMAVSPDGKLIATFAFGTNVELVEGQVDNSVRLWNVPSDVPMVVLPHHAPVMAAAFAGDHRLLTGTVDGSIAFWNLELVRSAAPTPLGQYDEGGAVLSIATSPTQTIAVTAAIPVMGKGSGKLCGWESVSGTRVWCRPISSAGGKVLIVLAPDGHTVATGDEKGTIQIWTAGDGRPIRSMQHPSKGGITALAFSPGSNQIASGDEKGEMHVWSLADGRDQFAVSHRNQVSGIAYSPSQSASTFIATVSLDGSLRLIDPSAFGPWTITEYRFDYALWNLAIDPTGRLISVARGDGFVDLWNRDEERTVGRMNISTGNVATGLAFVPENILAVVDGGQGVSFAQVVAQDDVDISNATESADNVALSPAGLLLASDFYGKGRAWDLSGNTGKPSQLQLSSFTHAAFSPRGNRVAVIDENANFLRVLGLPSGSEIAHWRVPGNIGGVAWSPNRDLVAFAKRDGGLWVYDPNSQSNLALTETGGSLPSFSPDSSQIAVVVPNQGLRIWDWNSKTEPWMPDGTSNVISAVFTSKGVLLLADNDRVVRAARITSTKSGAPLQQVWSAEFCAGDKHVIASPDGLFAAVFCDDGRIRVWSAASGAIVSDLHYSGKAKAAVFSWDSRLLVAGGDNGLRAFVISGTDLIAEACRRVSRNLSQAEWARYIGNGRCRPICAGKSGCD